MVSNKQQHWVPRCYLEAWVDPNTPPDQTPYVHIFDRHGNAQRRRSPAKIFKMPDLYTIFEGEERNLRIEHAFAKWEDDFIKVRTLIEAERFGSDHDVAALYAFTGAMIARPPHRIGDVKAQWASIVKRARSIRIDPNVPPIPSLAKGPSMSLDQAQELVENPMGTWFPGVVASNIKALFKFFGCDVLVNVSEHPFLTSDAPAVVFHQPPRDDDPRRRMMPRGLGSPGCEITLPLSPRTALLFRHKAAGIHAFMSANWETVFDINFRTITRAHETIISDRPDIFFVKTITDLVAQVDSGAS